MKLCILFSLLMFVSSVTFANVFTYKCKNNEDTSFAIKFDNSRFIIKSGKANCFGTSKEVSKSTNLQGMKISLAQLKVKDSELLDVPANKNAITKCVLFESSIEDHSDLETTRYIILSNEILAGKTEGKVFLDGFMTRGIGSCSRIN